MKTIIVFLLKGISPGTRWQKEKARRATRIYIPAWLTGALVLVALFLQLEQMNSEI